MTQLPELIEQLLQDDPRYKFEAYQFVRDALSFAQESLGMGEAREEGKESHLTGQELCESIRQYAQEQYGFLAKVVLNSWGVYSTSDFGDIVYNMINIGLMKKSKSDRREHFDDVYNFDLVFEEQFEITMPE